MDHCLEEYKNIAPNEIAEKYIEGEPQIGDVGVLPNQTNRSIQGLANEDTSVNEGEVLYDIRFYAYAPDGDGLIKLIINVEAQNKYYLSYPLIKRGIYYLARMISAQYGTEFDRSHYEEIKKVYSIWICADPPKNRENTITRYRIREENLVGNVHENERNYDLMNATMICMGDAAEDNGILKLLNVLLSRDETLDTRKEILNEDFGIIMSYQMEEETAKMCNLSQGLIEKGIQQGMQRGIQQGIYSALQNLMHNAKMSFEEAVLMLGIPKEEQKIYKKLMENKA